jgi:hypothetical protein
VGLGEHHRAGEAASLERVEAGIHGREAGGRDHLDALGAKTLAVEE